MLNSLLHRRARMLVTQAKDDWFLYIQRYSENTQDCYRRIIRGFFAGLPDKYITSIKPATIRTYLTKCRWIHKATTCNNHLMALKTLFRFLNENYDIPNITIGIRKFKQDTPYQGFISHDQYLKILESATKRESDIIKLLAHTGVRAMELCQIKENIKDNLSSIYVVGKGSKPRTIPCNQTVREILSRDINLPKNRKEVYRICQRAGKRVGIKLSPHILRRYHATQLLNKGISLLIISRLLGHSSVRTTEIYLHCDSSLDHVTDCLD